MKRQILTLPLLVVLSLLACQGAPGGGTSSTTSGGTTSGGAVSVPIFWSAATDAGATTPLYSFDFEDGIPPFILVYFPIFSPTESCGALLSDLKVPGDRWYLSIGFQPSGVSTIPVGGSTPAAVSAGMAVVELSHLSSNESGSETQWETFAVNGTLAVSSAPMTTGQQDAGAIVQANLSATFVDNPVDLVKCVAFGEVFDAGGSFWDGGSCACEDGNDDSFQCEIPVGEPPASCCDGGTAASGRYTLSFSFSASACGALCGGFTECAGL